MIILSKPFFSSNYAHLLSPSRLIFCSLTSTWVIALHFWNLKSTSLSFFNFALIYVLLTLYPLIWCIKGHSVLTLDDEIECISSGKTRVTNLDIGKDKWAKMCYKRLNCYVNMEIFAQWQNTTVFRTTFLEVLHLKVRCHLASVGSCKFAVTQFAILQIFVKKMHFTKPSYVQSCIILLLCCCLIFLFSISAFLLKSMHFYRLLQYIKRLVQYLNPKQAEKENAALISKGGSALSIMHQALYGNCKNMFPFEWNRLNDTKEMWCTMHTSQWANFALFLCMFGSSAVLYKHLWWIESAIMNIS